MKFVSVIHDKYFAPIVAAILAAVIIGAVATKGFTPNEIALETTSEFDHAVTQPADIDSDVSIKTADGDLFTWQYKFLGFTVSDGSRETYDVVINNPQGQPLENCRLIRSQHYESRRVGGGHLNIVEQTSSEGWVGSMMFSLPATKQGLFYFFDEKDWVLDRVKFKKSEIKLRLICKNVVTHWHRVDPNNIEIRHSTG